MSYNDVSVTRFGRHRNAFGFIRLTMASLVILSHTPEIIDGNRNREILTMIFGTISFGELAVDVFFIVSGYLITASYQNSETWYFYLNRRVSRIYPAFIFASFFCIFIVAPLGGAVLGDVQGITWRSFLRALMLQVPDVGPVFSGTHYATLNGAMWTIAYEFKCYLLVIFFGAIGILKRKLLIPALALSFLLLYESGCLEAHHVVQNYLRLVGMFLSGASFYLWRSDIEFTAVKLLFAIILLVVSLFSVAADIGVAIFGAYAIFAISVLGAKSNISNINNNNDISYGVYLYAFPIEKLILWYYHDMNILIVGGATFVFSLFFGWVSWHALEKPIMKFSKYIEARISERTPRIIGCLPENSIRKTTTDQ